jgi:membrane protein implicated in regulation of membrane protease activity
VNQSQILIILGIISIFLELILGVATGFDLFLVGLSLIVGGGLGLVFTDTVGLISTLVLIVLYIVFGRAFLKSKLTTSIIPSNSDALIGKNGVVTAQISPHHPGKIKIDGEIWRAESDTTIDIGKSVVVKSLSGVTLKVVSV